MVIGQVVEIELTGILALLFLHHKPFPPRRLFPGLRGGKSPRSFLGSNAMASSADHCTASLE
jgi:hypothetical protein